MNFYKISNSIVLALIFTPMILFADTEYESAVKKFKNQDYKGAIEQIRQLHDTGGSTFESHTLCAHAYSKLGDFESSSAHFFEALKKRPESTKVRADLIRLYLNHNKTKGALELSTDAIEKFTDDPEIQFLYATTLLRRGKLKTALSRVEKLKSLAPNDANILNLEGKIYYSLGIYDKADVSLKWASALDQSSPSILNNLALVQERLFLVHKKNKNSKLASENLKEAKDSIKKALSLDAKDSSISKNAERILNYSI